MTKPGSSRPRPLTLRLLSAPVHAHFLGGFYEKVLVIGGGARESALALKFSQSPQVDHVYVAPGNPAMELLGVEPIGIKEKEVPALIKFAQTHQIDLTFVGPEVPLAAGIVDDFQAIGLPIFGVTQKLAQLESSKTFAKAFMHRHHLPTAASKTVHSAIEAHAEATLMGLPLVLKKMAWPLVKVLSLPMMQRHLMIRSNSFTPATRMPRFCLRNISLAKKLPSWHF